MANTVLHLSQVTDENNVVIEGGVNLNVPLDNITTDIEIIFPNNNSKILNKQMLTDSTLVSSDVMLTPSILVPTNNMLNFEGTFLLSPYKTTTIFDGEHTGTILDISLSSDFDVIYKSIVMDTPTTEIEIDVLPGDTTFYARVKYISGDYISNVSETVMFTTINSYTLKPKILFPTNNGIDVSITPMVQIGDYNYIGGMNTHESTEWEIATDELFTNIVRSGSITVTQTVNGRSFIIGEALDENKNYYIRARYVGVLYGDSQWSNIVTFKTLNVEDFISVFNTTKESLFFNSTLVDENTFIHVGYDRVINSGQARPFIIKTDKNNVVIKSKKIIANYTAVDDATFQSVTHYNNKIYAGGYCSTSSGNFLILCVFDMELNILNAKVFPATANVQTYCRKIIFNGEYLYLFGTKDRVGFVSKLKISDLSLIKSVKIYDTIATENIATFIQDAIFWNNNFYLSGESYSNGNNSNIIILKLDTDLNMISKKLLTPSPTSYFERIQSLDKDSNNNFYFVGYISNGVNNFKPYILKTDSNFNILISKEFNGTIPGRGLFESIKIDSNNNIIIGGKLNQNTTTLMDDNYTNTMDGFILKMDTNLNIKESLFLGQDNFGENLFSINIKENNLIYFSGATGGKESTHGNAMFGMLNLKGDYLSTAGINTNIKIKDLTFNTGQSVSLTELNNNIVASTLSLTLGNLVYTEEDLTFLISVKKDIY